jgi:hypothetical protein
VGKQFKDSAYVHVSDLKVSHPDENQNT